jgi:hypothetical protein
VKHRLLFRLAFLTVVLASSVSARADIDGYFCTSKGYVAYELREGITPSIVGHVLRVVRVEPDRGIYVAGEVTLLDFEVYHLTCAQDHIEISGWRKVFTKYIVDIEPSREMKVVGPTEYPDLQWSAAAKDGPKPQSLSLFGPKVEPLPVQSLDAEHNYQLLRNLSGQQVKEGWQRHSRSELVQLDKNGSVSQRFVLYERRDVEPRENFECNFSQKKGEQICDWRNIPIALIDKF